MAFWAAWARKNDLEIPRFFAAASIWLRVSSDIVILTQTALGFMSGIVTTKKGYSISIVRISHNFFKA